MLALLSGCVFLPSFWLKLNFIPVFIVFASWKHFCFQTGEEPGTLHLASSPKWSQFNSVAQLCPTLWPHGLQHAGPPCPSSTPGVYSNSYPLSRWCHPAISSSVIPFSSHLQGLSQHQGLFQWVSSSHLVFRTSHQSIGVSASASVLPMDIQDWSPLGWTGWISFRNTEDSNNS